MSVCHLWGLSQIDFDLSDEKSADDLAARRDERVLCEGLVVTADHMGDHVVLL